MDNTADQPSSSLQPEGSTENGAAPVHASIDSSKPPHENPSSPAPTSAAIQHPTGPPPAYVGIPDPGQFGPYPPYQTGAQPYCGAPMAAPYSSGYGPSILGSVPYYPQGPPIGYTQGPYIAQPFPYQQPQQQQQQQTTLVCSGSRQPQYVAVRTQSFVGHIVLACIVIWCCGFLFGLIGFILASKCVRLGFIRCLQ